MVQGEGREISFVFFTMIPLPLENPFFVAGPCSCNLVLRSTDCNKGFKKSKYKNKGSTNRERLHKNKTFFPNRKGGRRGRGRGKGFQKKGRVSRKKKGRGFQKRRKEKWASVLPSVFYDKRNEKCKVNRTHATHLALERTSENRQSDGCTKEKNLNKQTGCAVRALPKIAKDHSYHAHQSLGWTMHLRSGWTHGRYAEYPTICEEMRQRHKHEHTVDWSAMRFSERQAQGRWRASCLARSKESTSKNHIGGPAKEAHETSSRNGQYLQLDCWNINSRGNHAL